MTEVENFIRVIPLVKEVSDKKVNDIFTLKDKGRNYNEHKSSFLADTYYSVAAVEKSTLQSKQKSGRTNSLNIEEDSGEKAVSAIGKALLRKTVKT